MQQAELRGTHSPSGRKCHGHRVLWTPEPLALRAFLNLQPMRTSPNRHVQNSNHDHHCLLLPNLRPGLAQECRSRPSQLPQLPPATIEVQKPPTLNPTSTALTMTALRSPAPQSLAQVLVLPNAPARARRHLVPDGRNQLVAELRNLQCPTCTPSAHRRRKAVREPCKVLDMQGA